MKIAIVTKGGLPIPNVQGGGVETLCTYFLKQNEIYQQLDITVFCIKNSEADSESKKYKKAKFVQLEYCGHNFLDKVRNRITKEYPLEYPYSYRKAAKIIDREQYDRIILENMPWQLPFFVKKFGDKVILHLHNDYINPQKDDEYQNKYKKNISHMHSIITVSEFIKKQIIQVVPEFKDKIHVLYNATDIDLYAKRADESEQLEFRKKLGINDTDFVFIYTGRLCDEKGVKELVQAFNLLCEKYRQIKLLVVGSVSYGSTVEDSYTQMLDRLIEDNKASIITTGFINYDEMYRYYSIADVQVIPSKWDEPFGLVAIEGMSQGLPIISTGSGGLSEILNDKNTIFVGKTKLKDELYDAMEYLINNPDKIKEMRTESIKIMRAHKEFGLEDYYKNFISLIMKK